MPKRRQPLRSLEQTRLAAFEEAATYNRGYIRRSCSPQPHPYNQADILKFVRTSAEKENYESTVGHIDGVSHHCTSASSSPELTSSQTRRKRRRVVPSSDAEDYDYLSSDSSYFFASPVKISQKYEVEKWEYKCETCLSNDSASADGDGRLECNNSAHVRKNKTNGQGSNELSDGYYSCSEIHSDKAEPGKKDLKDEVENEVTSLNANYCELTRSEPKPEVRATVESETACVESIFRGSATSISSVVSMITGTRGEDYIPDTYAEDNQVEESGCDEKENERTTDDRAIDDNWIYSTHKPNDEPEDDNNVTFPSSCIPSSEWSECESLHSDTEEPDGLAGLAYPTPETKKPTLIFSSSCPSHEASSSQDSSSASFRTNSVPSTQKPPSIYYQKNQNRVSPIRQSQSRSPLSTRDRVSSQLKFKVKTQSLSNSQVSGSTDECSQMSIIGRASDNSYADHFAISQSDGRIENSLLTDSVMFSLPLPPEMKFNVGQSTQLSDG
ncbi:hypothetical protein V1520DRAFT_339731 [Lipomyces starkeyi]|uniref:Uncharacterized protein n=1 Tax=Lipomyces starkeyi NRRL Y-11557 TaxID=675824 RepID=A0A1E3Q288_LIPST|nr:hypothetical protein LIPSTDRAFT_106099 [Lipomyces starkeyi NRRL Y-11557]